jgi:glycosyltransferase involved in cell wall biosynthesis
MKMAQAFTALGHNVWLAVPQFPQAYREITAGSLQQPPEYDNDWKHLMEQYGIQNTFPIRYFSTLAAARHYDFSLKALYWAHQNGSDYIYTRLPQIAAIGSTLNTATIFEAHDMPGGKMGPRLFRRYLKGRGAARLVAITRALADDLSQVYGLPAYKQLNEGLVIAPDGVDLERYQDIPEPAEARKILLERQLIDDSIPGGRFTAGYTGHLYQGRGVNLILEIAARLPGITFLMIGGEAEQIFQLKSSVASRGLKNVSVVGFIPNAQLPLYQAACEALMMPYQGHVAASSGGDISRYLSPMKLFEYMACGRTILASDLPVLKEVLNARNALLLPPEDTQAWVSALETLQREPERWEALAGQARTDAKDYSWEQRARRILDGL